MGHDCAYCHHPGNKSNGISLANHTLGRGIAEMTGRQEDDEVILRKAKFKLITDTKQMKWSNAGGRIPGPS